jgi:hypothetical protein
MNGLESVIKAYGEGKIGEQEAETLGLVPKDVKKQHIRYAPSCIAGIEPSGVTPDRPYTAKSLAVFSGETFRHKGALDANERVIAALGALELIERKRRTSGTCGMHPLIPSARYPPWAPWSIPTR